MNIQAQDMLDPWLRAGDKGIPLSTGALRRSEVGAQGWNVLRGDLPLPLAVIKRSALKENIGWMQRFVAERGLVLAPHGKTTMSPQLFDMQLAAGAWGITVANVAQLAVAVASGGRRCIIASQVMDPVDLAGIEQLLSSVDSLQVLFLVDSVRQIEIIEAARPPRPVDVLLEIGVPGARTGVRNEEEAVAVARRAHASKHVRLRGIECYEGLGATGDAAKDTDYVQSLIARVHAIAHQCDQNDWFDGDDVIISAGGSAVFDLVANVLLPELRRAALGVMRSGCYITHDDGMYARLGASIGRRLGCNVGLTAALEVWGVVLSRPEPGLAILGVGKRDVSYDIDMPRPLRWLGRGAEGVTDVAGRWTISGLNDQHAYLRIGEGPGPEVGDRVGLGVSHPCTTFDKWSWLAVVDENYDVVDALTTCF